MNVVAPGFLALDWTNLASLVAVAGIVGAVLWGYLRFRLQALFVTKASHTELTEDVAGIASRIGAVEKAAAAVPRHEDMQRLSDRVGSVESGLGELRGEVRGAREGVGRIEHMVDLLLQNALKRDEA